MVLPVLPPGFGSFLFLSPSPRPSLGLLELSALHLPAAASPQASVASLRGRVLVGGFWRFFGKSLVFLVFLLRFKLGVYLLDLLGLLTMFTMLLRKNSRFTLRPQAFQDGLSSQAFHLVSPSHVRCRRLPLPSQLHRSFVTLLLVLLALLLSVLQEVRKLSSEEFLEFRKTREKAKKCEKHWNVLQRNHEVRMIRRSPPLKKEIEGGGHIFDFFFNFFFCSWRGGTPPQFLFTIFGLINCFCDLCRCREEGSKFSDGVCIF